MIGLIAMCENPSDEVISGIKIIGLTGGIGSGKSTAAKLFKELGAYVIDADKISHEVMEPNMPAYKEVVDVFGNEISNDDKSINRKHLAKLVFNDKSKLELLNGITHKYIFADMQNRIDAYTANHDLGIIILDVPLLFNSDFPISCDKTIAVVADRDVRIKRTVRRDNCTAAQVKERMCSQLSDDELIALADYSIDNSSELSDLKNHVQIVYNQIIDI